MASTTTFRFGDVRPFVRRDKDSGELVERRFRFNISAGLAFEQDSREGINALIARGQSLTALVKGLYYGFRWEDRALTQATVEGDIENFVNGGGDIGQLFSAMVDALNASGTFGRQAVEKPAADEPGPLAGEPATTG